MWDYCFLLWMQRDVFIFNATQVIQSTIAISKYSMKYDHIQTFASITACRFLSMATLPPLAVGQPLRSSGSRPLRVVGPTHITPMCLTHRSLGSSTRKPPSINIYQIEWNPPEYIIGELC